MPLQNVQPERPLPARWKQGPPEPIQVQPIPQRQRQPARARLAGPMHLKIRDLHPHYLARYPWPTGTAPSAATPSRRRSPRSSSTMRRSGPSLISPRFSVSLNHPPVAVAVVRHHAPVAVPLAVLEADLGAHKYAGQTWRPKPDCQRPRSALQPLQTFSRIRKQRLTCSKATGIGGKSAN